MSRSRAYTRHQWQRARGRAKRFLKILDMQSDGLEWKMADDERTITYYATDRKPCTCGICKDERYDRQWEGKEPLKFEIEDYERM